MSVILRIAHFRLPKSITAMSSLKPKCISLFARSAVIARGLAYDGINKNGLN